MYSKLSLGLIILFAAAGVGCGTTVPTTLTKSWEKKVAFDSPDDLNHTQIYLADGGEAVTLVSPGGVETLDSRGTSVFEVDRQKFFRTYVQTTRGAEELTDKITYLYLPHRHSLLEFNYSITGESVTMIDLNDREITWLNEDLKWSLERYQVAVRTAAKGMSLIGGAAASAVSEILLPDRFVKNMTSVIPEKDAMLFKTLDGLKLISLESGKVLWNNEDVKGGIAEMIYDEESNSIIVVNSDDDAFKLDGFQFNKQIARLDAETGETVWMNRYDGNIREKLDGIGIWADRRADVRLLDDTVMLNFLNVELYDFETGEQLWQTSEGANKMLDMVAPEAQIMNLFAFPVVHNGTIYRVGFENVGLTGVDVIIEAYDKRTGDRLWKSDKLSRSQPVNNMEVADGKLIITMGSSEGVVALDTATGERFWNYEGFGNRGVQHFTHATDNGILAAGNDKIALLDTQTGKEVYTIDADKEELGKVMDFQMVPNGIAVSGSKGFGIFDVRKGTPIKKIATPTGGIIRTGNNRMLIMPKPNYADAAYPVDGAFHVVDHKNGLLVGSLGNDGSRRAWKATDDFKQMYVLEGEKLVMYEAR